MKQGIQTLMQEAGEAACYALAIIKIAERLMNLEIYPINAFYEAFEKGYIYYNKKMQTTMTIYLSKTRQRF